MHIFIIYLLSILTLIEFMSFFFAGNLRADLLLNGSLVGNYSYYQTFTQIHTKFLKLRVIFSKNIYA